jgi:hypothetical protein
MPSAFAVWPQQDSAVSLKSSLREAAAFTRESINPEDFPNTEASGRGRPVLVVPGFFSPDVATARLRAFLARQDFAVHPWGQGINIGPTKSVLSGLEREMERLNAHYGKPLALIGQSLGGTIAREAAKRRPDLVEHVLTIVAPIRVPVITTLAPLADVMAHLWDRDARATIHQLSEPPPMRLTAIVAPRDGLVDYRSCLPDPAPNVEVIMIDGTHTTMGSNPTVQRIVAEKLSAG